MKFKTDSTLYIILGSIILGISSTVLYMLGYFPDISRCILCGLMTSVLFLVYLMFVSIMIYVSGYMIQTTVIPLIISSFGVISASALTLSANMNNGAKSVILLFFVFSAMLIFACCNFYKLIVWVLYERGKRYR